MHNRMRRTRPVGWLALALVVSGGIVHASAPSNQYDFFTPSDDVIEDKHTGLVWQRSVVGSSSHEDAATECSNFSVLELEADKGQWRLPTVKELLTLVDEEMYGTFENGEIVYRPIDRNAFPNTPTELFWTSTHDFQDDGDIWMVDFSDGKTAKDDKGSLHYYRCVRNK